MATMITSECINCGACEPECPNTAIYQGGVEWEFKGTMHPALAADIFYIVPEKCTECVGFHDQEACAAVCPVDCCIPNPDIPESEAQLIARAKELHPETDFGAEFPSRFRKEGNGAAAPAETKAAPAPAPVGSSAPAAVSPVAAPPAAPAAAAAAAFDIPPLDEWELPIECFRCEGSYAVPYRHLRSGVVLYCPFCNGSYVVTTTLYDHVRQALTDFAERWDAAFEKFRTHRQRELEEFEERQRSVLAAFQESLREISKTAKAPGAPRKRAGIFG